MAEAGEIAAGASGRRRAGRRHAPAVRRRFVRRRHHQSRCSSTSRPTPRRSRSWSACSSRAERSRPRCRRGCRRRSTGCSATSTTLRTSVGGHVRIYTRHRAEGQAARAGLGHHRQPPRPRAALAVLVAEVRRRRRGATTIRLVNAYRRFLEWEIVAQPRSLKVAERAPHRCSARASSSTPARVAEQSREPCRELPDIDGVIVRRRDRADRRVRSPRCSSPTGMIPWFPGGHCDPWNHVETAMALDVAGLHAEAERAYDWLVDMQRADGSWWNYYLPDGSVEEAKLDTNVCAYVATGVWHHWLCTWDRGFVDHLWPTVAARARLGAVDAPRRRHGAVGVARRRPRRGTTPCSPARRRIAHALRCGAGLADADRRAATDWVAAADRADRVDHRPPTSASNRRIAGRWTGTTRCSPACLTGERAKIRLADGWSDVRDGGPRASAASATSRGSPRRRRRNARSPTPRSATSRPPPTWSLDPSAPPPRRRLLDRHRLSDEGALPVRRGLRLHRGRRDPRGRRDRRRRHRQTACSCRAATTEARSPSSRAGAARRRAPPRGSPAPTGLAPSRGCRALRSRRGSGCRHRSMSADRSGPMPRSW